MASIQLKSNANCLNKYYSFGHTRYFLLFSEEGFRFRVCLVIFGGYKFSFCSRFASHTGDKFLFTEFEPKTDFYTKSKNDQRQWRWLCAPSAAAIKLFSKIHFFCVSPLFSLAELGRQQRRWRWRRRQRRIIGEKQNLHTRPEPKVFFQFFFLVEQTNTDDVER